MKWFGDMSEALETVERRAVQVHGAAAGAFFAAQEMFGGLVGPEDMDGFVKFLRAKCETASEQREEAVNVNQFWVNLISAFGRGVFGMTALEQQRFFVAIAVDRPHPPLAANQDEHGDYVQGSWKEWRLFVEMNGVLDVLRKDLRQQGITMALDKADLIEQMSKRPYYSALNGRGRDGRDRRQHGVQQRFGGSKTPLRCVAIEVDKMEAFGYRQVSDAALEESRLALGQEDLPGTEPRIRMASDKWIDPRKGDIYTIVEAVGKTD